MYGNCRVHGKTHRSPQSGIVIGFGVGQEGGIHTGPHIIGQGTSGMTHTISTDIISSRPWPPAKESWICAIIEIGLGSRSPRDMYQTGIRNFNGVRRNSFNGVPQGKTGNNMPGGLENTVHTKVIQMEFNGVAQDVTVTGIQGKGVFDIFPPSIRTLELRVSPNRRVMSGIHKPVLDHTVQIGVHVIAKNPMIIH